MSDHGVLPVMDNDGRHLGTLTAGTVAEALAEGTGGGPGVPSTAGELAEFPGLIDTCPWPPPWTYWWLLRAPACPSWTRNTPSWWDGSPTKAPCAPWVRPPRRDTAAGLAVSRARRTSYPAVPWARSGENTVRNAPRDRKGSCRFGEGVPGSLVGDRFGDPSADPGSCLWYLFAVSGFAARSVLSTSLLFLLAGAAVGDGALGLVHIASDSPLVTATADLALFTVLFTDGMHVSFRAWFGPKGFASVVYGLLVLQAGIPQGEQAYTLIAVCIAVSIAVHSSSDVPIARLFHVDDLIGIPDDGDDDTAGVVKGRDPQPPVPGTAADPETGPKDDANPSEQGVPTCAHVIWPSRIRASGSATTR